MKEAFEIAKLLGEFYDDGLIESTVYLALGVPFGEYKTIRDQMVKAGLINVRNHRLVLTQKGKDVAKQPDGWQLAETAV